MVKNVLFLAGAPAAESLGWGENGLTTGFLHPVLRFMGEDRIVDTQVALTSASCPLAKWREIPLKRQKETTTTWATRSPQEAAKFVSFKDDDEEEHLNFLEHSLAVLQNLDSSQIGPPDDTTIEESTYITLGSFETSLSIDPSVQTSSASLTTFSSEDPEQQVVNFDGPVMDLKRIPNARQLRAIHPQTMTVNVLASVISVQPTRTVRLRKRNGEMDIVEVLLGDETRAGFTTTFWLVPLESQTARPPASNARQHELREMLDHLRAGDVLLLTHVALSEFNNNVFGQTLSRRTTRNNTTVTILSDGVVGLSGPLLAKAKRVRDWTGKFVGRSTKRAAPTNEVENERKKQRSDTELPPDTQY